ncbi:TIR domain-containing protein [Pedobacter aquatilis]|uniref:TIR domain-containing protein n=1 Tax=Pedobacter aquatilis TaxID=351343 RepID=UPI0029311DF1|nr:TIR domain-containing protein [Pedobacter aquatilis]
MAIKVFISYDHSEDRLYKDLLRAWDANTSFEFEFDQRSPNIPIDSIDAAVIKGSLTKKLQQSQCLLVLIGAKSYTSKWMAWEIEKAKSLGLKLVAIKLSSTNQTPAGLLNARTVFATAFTQEKIITALKTLA